MAEENASQGRDHVGILRHARAAMLLEFVIVVFLSGWIILEYLHNVFLQDYVRTTIESNAPILQFAVPVGLTLILSSFLFQRRREVRETQAALRREEVLAKINFTPVSRPAEHVPHQVFAIPRPARDPKFRVHKTSSKGRMSRNRAGQRIPPED